MISNLLVAVTVPAHILTGLPRNQRELEREACRVLINIVQRGIKCCEVLDMSGRNYAINS